MNFQLLLLLLPFSILQFGVCHPSSARRNDEQGNYAYEYGVSHPSGSSKVHVKAGGGNRKLHQPHLHTSQSLQHAQSRYGTYPPSTYSSSGVDKDISSQDEHLPIYKEPGQILKAKKSPVLHYDPSGHNYQPSYSIPSNSAPSRDYLPVEQHNAPAPLRDYLPEEQHNAPVQLRDYLPEDQHNEPVQLRDYLPEEQHYPPVSSSDYLPEEQHYPSVSTRNYLPEEQYHAPVSYAKEDNYYDPSSEHTNNLNSNPTPVQELVDVDFHAKSGGAADNNKDIFQDNIEQNSSFPPFPTDVIENHDEKPSVPYPISNQDDTPIVAPTSSAQVAGHIHVPSPNDDVPFEQNFNSDSGRKTKPKYVFVPSGPPYTSVSHSTHILHAPPRSNIPLSHVSYQSPDSEDIAKDIGSSSPSDLSFSSLEENIPPVLNAPNPHSISHSVRLPLPSSKENRGDGDNSFVSPVSNSIKLPESSINVDKVAPGSLILPQPETFQDVPPPQQIPNSPLSHSIRLPVVPFSLNKDSDVTETGPTLPEAEALRYVPEGLPKSPISHSIRLAIPSTPYDPEISDASSLSLPKNDAGSVRPLSEEISAFPLSHSIRLPVPALARSENLRTNPLSPTKESGDYISPISHSIRLNPLHTEPISNPTVPNASFLAYNEPIAVETASVSPISHALRIPLPDK